jgi:NitT/TauT family transport system ATP-binding protein
MTAADAPVLEVVGARKTYATGTQALAPVDLTVRRGEFVTLLGPSGCGKTTLLNLMAGLLAPDAGTLRWWGGGIEMTGAPGRNLAMVFQSPTLMPWARVTTNVRLPLDLAGVPRSAADDAVAKALAASTCGSFRLFRANFRAACKCARRLRARVTARACC